MTRRPGGNVALLPWGLPCAHMGSHVHFLFMRMFARHFFYAVPFDVLLLCLQRSNIATAAAAVTSSLFRKHISFLLDTFLWLDRGVRKGCAHEPCTVKAFVFGR